MTMKIVEKGAAKDKKKCFLIHFYRKLVQSKLFIVE